MGYIRLYRVQVEGFPKLGAPCIGVPMIRIAVLWAILGISFMD